MNTRMSKCFKNPCKTHKDGYVEDCSVPANTTRATERRPPPHLAHTYDHRTADIGACLSFENITQQLPELIRDTFWVLYFLQSDAMAFKVMVYSWE
jgi:hypothetical protein